MAVYMKKSRESTTALVKEVCGDSSGHNCLYISVCSQFIWIKAVFVIDLKKKKTISKRSWLSQWKYDQTTATYLLLLSKKRGGKPVRLRREPAACEDSPLHRELQVRILATSQAFNPLSRLSRILRILSVPLRLERAFTSLRMTRRWLLVLWTSVRTTLMTVHGSQSHSTDPMGSEVKQTETPPETRYVAE